MRRVILTKLERKKEQFRRMLRAKKAVEKISDYKIADLIGVSQPAVVCKNKKAQYNYEDLVLLFDALQYTDEEILKVMKYKEE